MTIKTVNSVSNHKQQDLVLQINDRLNNEAAMLRFLEVVLADGRDYVAFSGEELYGLGFIISNINDHTRQTGLLVEQLIAR